MRQLFRAVLTALCLVSVLGVASPVFAQVAAPSQAEAVNYEAWERTASRAESVLERALASDDALGALRLQLTEWRERFLSAQGTNKQRIMTLREQLTALGPKPEGDVPEDPVVAGRRAELQELLSSNLVPVKRAEEAYTRADGLITQLDTLARDRQASILLRLDPTPINPVLWPNAIGAVVGLGQAVTQEVSKNYQTRRAALGQGLAVTVILLVVGIILVFRSGPWIERGLNFVRVRRSDGGAAFRVGTFLASFFGVILPVLGIMALLFAVDTTELAGNVGNAILDSLSDFVVCFATARWISTQVFPKASPPKPLLFVDGMGLSEGRFYTLMLALLLALQLSINSLSQAAPRGVDMSNAVLGVLYLPVTVLAGLMLFRFGQILIKSTRDAAAAALADETAKARPSLLTGGLGRALMFAGIAAPLAAAIGYTVAANTLIFSSTLTLALLAVLALLQRFVRDVYAMVMRDEEKANGLIPVLIGFGLAVLAMPVLALIWGARTAEISEAWAMISNGVQLGESRISPSVFLTLVVVFTLGYMLTKVLQNALETQILPKTKLDIGGRNAVVSGTGYVGIFLAALIAITSAGIDLSSLAIVAGALSVGIGFGLQTIVSNFVSGIILLVERPISEGDWIEVGGTMGVVRNISVRATRVETFDRRDVIVPNADLISTSVTNWTKGNLSGRVIVPVGVAYGTDTRRVSEVLQEIAMGHPQVIINPPPNVFFVRFGADSLDFEIRAILRDVNYSMVVPSELNHEIARRFAEEGFEIPFAQRDLWLRNPEVLPDAKPPPRARKPKTEG
ncbi:DUF3772 domain-containing protein [Litoreibacter sp.]|nr:DUF3772 domain-containing protein [Litoreibacter sp.]